MKTKKGFLGIDVSKGNADFILLDADRKVLVKPFQLDDNYEGHQRLKQLLSEWLSDMEIDCIECGMESTGGYENNWYGLLKELNNELPIEVTRFNPYPIKSHRDAELTRTITDSVSAFIIASFMISYPSKNDYQSVSIANFKSLRSQYSFIRMLKKQANQTVNQLEMLVYSSSPELLRWTRSGFPNWMVEMLSKYPTAKQIAKAGEKRIAKFKGLSNKKAAEIVEACKTTVAVQQDEYIATVVQSQALKLTSDLQLLKRQKELLAKNSAESCPNLVGLLTSITGVGKYSAACLIIEIEDVQRFEDASKLVSYSGIHPEFKKSGDGKMGNHMSKKGRAPIRGVLFNVARSAAVHDPHIKKIYERHRKKGKGYFSSIGVIMNKMLRIIYGVWKNQTPYNPKIDQQNIESSKPKEKRENKKTGKERRRYQEATVNAPISRKNYKKRKALAKPQSDVSSTTCEVNEQVP